MDSERQLQTQLQYIIAAKGVGAFGDPEALCAELAEMGADKGAAQLRLAFTACPSFAEMLTKKEPDPSEVRTVIGLITSSAGLTYDAARTLVGQVLTACGYESYDPEKERRRERFAALGLAKMPGDGGYEGMNRGSDSAKMRENDDQESADHDSDLAKTPGNSAPHSISFAAQYEDARLENALSGLRENPDDDAALADLTSLADTGNAAAAYQLGQYARKKGQNENAEAWYRRAAALGWGAAYGALAAMELAKDKPDMRAAARFGTRPDALLGKDGAAWVSDVSEITAYRHENEGRAVFLAILAAVTLVVSVIITRFHPFPGIFSLIFAALMLAVALYGKMADHYISFQWAFVFADAAWILLAVCLML